MGVVALVCVLVGLLGVTVLRPPTHQVSSVVSATDLIMTRGNVLSIVKDDVTVTATSKSGAPVTLSIGTTQDVKGWIGDAAYTEVIGVESDRTKLKAESHDAIGPSRIPSPTPAQSGAQSGVQSGAQPLAEPSSADLVQQLASSDMWFKQASGEGTVSLDLENVPSGRSALAASAAGPGDLTLTLTWKVEQTNTLAIIAFLAACVFALIALALFLTRWQLLRLRKIREARIEERRKADSLETSSINSAAVAERVAAARDSAPAHAPVEEPPAADEATVSNDSSTDAAAAMPVEEKAQWGAAVYTPAADESAENAPAEEEGADGASSEEEAAGEAAPSETDDATEAADSSDEAASNEPASNEVPQDDYVPDPLTDTFERRGRHGLDNGPIDQDPPERATTDTGVIDLSGIRGGRTLPSRRALREARNNGEQTVVVDGQEFNTGLIPITRPRAAEPAAPTSAPDDDASKTGGWTSIMSGWLKDRQEGK
ncbi:hypothetical protein QP500_05835 [Pauljensenia sp. UMB0018B]|uniref:Uncharacterized protein n=1 Tax=Schaalia odontolytica TaxID=1660 RepID=A0A2I1I0Z4_9ACTO|nr:MULTISPECIES: hypothetical protein [Actinomycetaceae]MDK7339978.1 hypothetical protein [Pauljensenia sp. UMB0018B]PKY64763.1 hypothetical protein CYJ22_04760 [Schaalia odontolytica]